MARGSLVVVGTGIRSGVQLTPEARAALEAADRVLFLVAEPSAAEAIRRIAPAAEPLDDLYEPGLERWQVYEATVERILAPVRAGQSVCVAFYGHAGVFAMPGHEAVRRARAEGFSAEMLPGISALDCLIADLGLDPGTNGCQSYEATDFVQRRLRIDTGALLVLWQVGAVGRSDVVTEAELDGLPLLVDRLLDLYPPGHEAICYEASPFPVGGPYVRRLPLDELAGETIPPLATLVVCPAAQPADTPAEDRSTVKRTADAATTLPLAE